MVVLRLLGAVGLISTFLLDPPNSPVAVAQESEWVVLVADDFSSPESGPYQGIDNGCEFRSVDGEYLIRDLKEAKGGLCNAFRVSEYTDSRLAIDVRFIGKEPAPIAYLYCRVSLDTSSGSTS